MKFYIFLTIVILAIVLPLVSMNKTHLHKCKKKSTYTNNASNISYNTNGMKIALNSRYFFVPNENLYSINEKLNLTFTNKKNNNYVLINCSDYTYCLKFTRNYNNSSGSTTTFTSVLPNTLVTNYLGTVPFSGMIDSSTFSLTSTIGSC